MLRLVEPNEKYFDQYRKAYQESLKKIKEGIIKSHNLMFENLDEIDLIEKVKRNRDETKLKPGYVPQFTYFLVDGDTFLGEIHLRTKLNEKLLKRSGHIGYGINPLYWKKGYGTKILQLGIKKIKELGVKDRLLLTCDDDNVGSFKIIENNGGILENTTTVIENGETFITRRYWINID